MPVHKIPGTDVEYALISFDSEGRERTDDPAGGLFSRTILDRIKTNGAAGIRFVTTLLEEQLF